MISMFWLQGLGCFLIWALYGVARTRRSHRTRNWARRVPRASRGVLAGFLFVVPAIVLGSLVVAMASGKTVLGPGFNKSGLAPWAWALIAFAGIGYVHCQTLATSLLVTMAEPPVTPGRANSSQDTTV